jgi:cysteinyl-tRNA synthetase
LSFNDVKQENGIYWPYLNAIDGLEAEILFYNMNYVLDSNKLNTLRLLKTSKKIIISEYVANNDDIQDAINKNYNEGFICFVRTVDNFHYNQIPNFIPNTNSLDILNLSDAQNCLYLLNSENFSTKEEMINAISSTNYDLVLIDLFFKGEAFTYDEINSLKTKANGGKRLVISYINIGAAETFRYYWNSNWKLGNPAWIKKKYEGYDDEYWVEFWNNEWQDIIYGNDNSYIKKIIDAGFDGAFLDNVEAYYFLYHD